MAEKENPQPYVASAPPSALAERHMNPEALLEYGPPPRQTLFGILAIVALVLVLGVALVLWMEHTVLSGV